GLAPELVGDRRQKPVLRGDRLRPRVQQRKATGAVGGFHHARRETGLPYGRRLLVARRAADRNLAPEEVGSGHAEVRGAVAHLGQERLRYFQDFEYVAVPFPLSDVV